MARTELRDAGRVLADLRLWLLLLLTVAGAVLGYARPFHYVLPLDTAADHRPYLLGGFNADRERSAPDSPQSFRWTFGDARVALPGVGAVAHGVTLRVLTGQPTAPVPSGWRVGDTPLLALPLASEAREYHVLVPPASGDLDLRITTPTFEAPGDPRALAFAADRLVVHALGASAPPLTALWLLVVVGGGYGLLRRWNVAAPWAFLAGVVAVMCAAWVLAFQRLGLTTFAPRLAVLLGMGYAGTAGLMPLLRGLSGLVGIAATTTERRAVAALVMLAFMVRLGGLLHPQAFTNDLGLHANNLRGVIRGAVIFTEKLPGEAGGGPAPYPPAQYVMLLPLGGLVSADLLLQAATSLADSLVIMWGWLLLRAAGAPGGAALWAGGLYLFALPMQWSLLVGEMANVWGQALVAPLTLALWRWETLRPPEHGWTWLRHAAVPGACLVAALLGHFGVFLSLLVFFAVYAAILLVSRGAWRRFVVLAAVALAVVVVLYYSAHLAIILDGRERAVVPVSLSRLWGALGKALAPAGLLGPLMPVVGMAGLGIVVRHGVRLRALLVAWWLSTLLSLGSLLVSEQALRWTLFVFPAMAWSGGFALHTLGERGRAARVLAYGILLVLVMWGAVIWYSHIGSYKH